MCLFARQAYRQSKVGTPSHFSSTVELTIRRGYAEKEGDPRQFHPWLRPPVHEKELEIDLRTGMKVTHSFVPTRVANPLQNYIGNEGNFWDTSTACVRRNLGRAIEMARACNLQDGPTLYEAYRLLGTGTSPTHEPRDCGSLTL